MINNRAVNNIYPYPTKLEQRRTLVSLKLYLLACLFVKWSEIVQIWSQFQWVFYHRVT